MTASAGGTEGLLGQVCQVVICPALGWTTGEVAPVLAAVRTSRAEGWAVTQASERKRACCLLLLKMPEA